MTNYTKNLPILFAFVAVDPRFAAALASSLVAVLILPAWLPNMSFSLAGNAPKAYWYLSRATAFVSLSLLWLSMALGLGITNKMARLWPGAPAAFALHE